MFQEDYSVGAQLFSTGNNFLLNWMNKGMILKNPRIVELNFNMDNYSGPEYVITFDSDRRIQINKPIPAIEVNMRFMSSEIEYTDKPFKFEEILKKDLTMEEMLKLAYSKIKK